LFHFNLVQLHVAQEGVSIETSSSEELGLDANHDFAAASCIELLGGLTNDQLRWTFSSFSVRELAQSGWDKNALPFSDGDESTHLWSELHENCTATEILIAGPPQDTVAYKFFQEHIFKGHGEVFRDGYFSSPESNVIDDYIQGNSNAISFSQLYDTLSSKFAEKATRTMKIPIMGDTGIFVSPTGKTFESGEYPLVRSVYMGVNMDPTSLQSTLPFFEYGFSDEGDDAMMEAGFWPIRDWEKLIMFTRLQVSGLGMNVSDIKESCGPSDGDFKVAGSFTVEPVALMWSEIYKLGCDTKIDVAGGGSSVGAARVCANLERGSPGKSNGAVLATISKKFSRNCPQFCTTCSQSKLATCVATGISVSRLKEEKNSSMTASKVIPHDLFFKLTLPWTASRSLYLDKA
jgi:ABC-type phosphate transport system substrate-binding protein